MKISPELFNELRSAVLPIMEASAICRGRSNERWRWDCLWRSGFQVNRLYNAGLNDNHIDTALKAIIRNAERA